MTGERALEIWTIYRRPADYPIFYVVRRSFVRDGGWLENDPEARLAIDLDEARKLIPWGLYRMPRQEDDEPQIVETWF